MPIKYHPDIPVACPPKEATPTNGVVYRASKKASLEASDFASHAERKLRGYDPKVCQCWGLSVWVSEEAVETARKLFPVFRYKRFILSGALGVSDGVIMQTPSESQPEHHTFWKAIDRDVSAQFTVYLNPEPEAS
jgi:hypothetical protein